MRARCSFVFVCAQRLAPALLALSVLVRPLCAQTQQPVETTAESGIKITVSNIYDDVPLHGYVPLRVLIINPTDSEGVWTIRTQTQEGYMGGSQSFTTETLGRVPARAEDTFEVLAPVDESSQNYYMRSIAISVNGPGVKNPELTWRSTNGGGYSPGSATTLVFGLSPTLATDQGSMLKDYYQNQKKYSQSCILPSLDPDSMSTDWRAYIGFDMIIFTSADWLNLTASVRAAVLQWVAAGGDLRLIADQDGGLSLPPRLGEHYGAGSILLFTTADLKAYEDDKFSTIYKLPTDRFLFNFNYQPPIWLADKVPAGVGAAGPPPAAATLLPNSFTAAIPVIKNQYTMVALVIVAFGILVGPLNLFVFCRGANRARLLWVTPLLSLGASALLLLFILLSEGVGGHGIYYRLTQLAPDGKFAVESQVNSSLTGVLLGREFHFADPAWLTVSHDGTPGDDSSHGTFSQDGTRYWGDWFGSRQAQTLVAEAVVPTRAAVRLEPTPPGAGAAAPSLRSEYNGQLQDLYYIDDAGNPWKTAVLSNGQVLRLQPSSLEEISSAWQSNIINAPGQLRAKLAKLTPQPGTFFAVGDDPDAPLQPNLSGLSWTSFRHLLTGPVAQ